MKKYCLLFGIIGFMIALAATVPHLAAAKAERSADEVIPQGVYVGEISIGGMTKGEAVQALEEEFAELANKKVTLRAGENELEATAGELGLSWKNPEIIDEALGIGTKGNPLVRYKALKDLEYEGKTYEVAYGVDKNAVSRLLEENEDLLNTQPVDGKLERRDGSFVVTAGIQGITVDIEKSASETAEFFQKEWDGSDTVVELAVDIMEPKGTREELAKVKDLLGSFQTSYEGSNAGRRQNIQNGTAKIDGTVIYPGEEFSAYDVTSPFEVENGYAVGGAYENGKVVDSIGGGICQVSTTLYNAVIRAELKVTERYPHSMTVTYVKPSEDAAIAGTYKNLRFVNSTDAPVYIEGYTADSTVAFNIYGQETRPENRSVEFISETLTTTDPGVQFQAVGEQPIGYMSVDQGAHVGYTVRLWKVVTVDGKEQEREIFNTSTYKPSAKIVLVGVGSANPEAVAAVSAAVNTQDEATIQAAIAQWNDTALQQAAAQQAAAQQAAAEQAAQQQQQEMEEAQRGEDSEEPQEGGDIQEPQKPQDEKDKDTKD